MNRLTNRMMMIAAGALALGSMAYGQTVLTAKIPFAFRASNTTMPAGTYRLTERISGGTVVLTMRNQDANRNLMAAGGPVDTYREGPPQVTFTCRKDACYLTKVRAAVGTVRYSLPSGKRAHGVMAATTVSIPISTTRGE